MGADAHQVVEPLLLHDERQGARHVVGGDRVKPQPEDPCETERNIRNEPQQPWVSM